MTLRIAVIGIGQVAREQYLPFLAKQKDVALGYWNRTPAAAAVAAEKFGGDVFASLDAVAAWRPTAAMILTAESARRDIARQIISSGVPRAFFEKPLVAAAGQAHVTEQDFHDAKSILDLARQRGCETAMVFNYRFFEQTLAAIEAIAARNLGQVTSFVALVHYACWSHCIDLIHHVAGEIEEITALAGTQSHRSPEVKIEAADVAAAIRTAAGATGTIIGTAAMKWQHPLYELIFTLENGRIHLRDLDGPLEILDGSKRLHEMNTLVFDGSRWAQYSKSFEQAVGAYLQSLRDGRPPPVPGMAGLRELQFEAALKRSIATGKRVDVRAEFPVG
jgi:predicted dehydrogenase